MKTLKQSKEAKASKSYAQQTARKALHLYELDQTEDAKKLAKRVSWRTLFIEAYTREAANEATHDFLGQQVKGVFPAATIGRGLK